MAEALSVVSNSLQGAVQQAEGIPAALADLRQLVSTGLAAPDALVGEAAAAAEAAGLIPPGQWAPGSPAWAAAWSGICQAHTLKARPLTTCAILLIRANGLSGCSRQLGEQVVHGRVSIYDFWPLNS